MAKGIQRQIKKALKAVDVEIHTSARSGGKFAAGLSSEGYAGGYRQALYDVQAALNGTGPYNSRFWPSPKGME